MEGHERFPQADNWSDYIFRMGDYVEHNEPAALEQQLLQTHPVLPGEREAYLWLQEHTDHPLQVELDDSGHHVVPKDLAA